MAMNVHVAKDECKRHDLGLELVGVILLTSACSTIMYDIVRMIVRRCVLLPPFSDLGIDQTKNTFKEHANAPQERYK